MHFRTLVYSVGIFPAIAVWVQGGIFDGFSDKASYGIQRVFNERFVGGRKKVIKFGFIVKGICNDGSITFI